MQILWVRGNENIKFTRPHTWFILGVRGSGKSTLLEHIGVGYLTKGATIMDLFGSRDGEGLGWCRSPYAKDKRILLVSGDNVDVASSFDVKNISKMRLGDFERYDIIISASPLYSSHNDEFLQVNRLINLMYKRMSWKRLIYTICRESANLYYSRLRISDNQLSAKAESTYLIREARHCGIAFGLDTLKYTSVDLDVRSVLDFLVLKRQGVLGLPDSLQWLYGYFEPAIVRKMPPRYFLMVAITGSLGLGEFPELQWHKKEKENILRSIGLKVEYGESKGTFHTVGDREHVSIINAYFKGDSMHKIGEDTKRSPATIHNHIKAHDKAINRSGFCPRCRRMKALHETEKAKESRI